MSISFFLSSIICFSSLLSNQFRSSHHMVCFTWESMVHTPEILSLSFKQTHIKRPPLWLFNRMSSSFGCCSLLQPFTIYRSLHLVNMGWTWLSLGDWYHSMRVPTKFSTFLLRWLARLHRYQILKDQCYSIDHHNLILFEDYTLVMKLRYLNVHRVIVPIICLLVWLDVQKVRMFLYLKYRRKYCFRRASSKHVLLEKWRNHPFRMAFI